MSPACSAPADTTRVYVFIIPTNLDDHTPPISHGVQIIELYDWKHHPPGMLALGQMCEATFFWFVLTLHLSNAVCVSSSISEEETDG